MHILAEDSFKDRNEKKKSLLSKFLLQKKMQIIKNKWENLHKVPFFFLFQIQWIRLP